MTLICTTPSVARQALAVLSRHGVYLNQVVDTKVLNDPRIHLTVTQALTEAQATQIRADLSAVPGVTLQA